MDLPSELWHKIVKGLEPREQRTLLWLCSAARCAVFSAATLDAGGAARLNAEQAKVWVAAVVLRKNLFVTGGAGVGKTWTVRQIVEDALAVETVAVVAPTGAAARVASSASLKASTIHRFFNIRAVRRGRDEAPVVRREDGDAGDYDSDVEEGDEEGKAPTAVLDRPTRARLVAVELLVLDEASMASRQMMELVDCALQDARHSEQPFGGCQVVAVGDMFQLAPVARGRACWAFEAKCWSVLNEVELTQVVRQQDRAFADFLNRARVGRVTEADMAWLRQNCATRYTTAPLALLPSHKKCQKVNDTALQAMPGSEIRLAATLSYEELCSEEDGGWRAIPEESLPRPPALPNVAASVLRLKVGCRVRCVRNVYTGTYPDREIRVANGERGTLLEVRAGEVVVEFDPLESGPGRRIRLDQCSWRKSQRFQSENGYKVRVVARQFPIVVAFGVTVHSAQGGSVATLIDVDPLGWQPAAHGEWERKPAMAYVALSRATDVKNVRLLSVPQASDFVVEPVVRERYGGGASTGCVP